MLQPHPYCAVSVCYHQGSLLAPTGALCVTKRHCLSVMYCTHLTQQTNTEGKKYSRELSMQCPMKIVQSSWSKKEQCCNITTTIFVRAYPRCPCYTGATHHCAECHLRYSSLYMIRDNKFFKWTLP